jgi:hypothetical protein
MSLILERVLLGHYYTTALMFQLEHYKSVIGLPNETWKFQVQEALDWMGSLQWMKSHLRSESG